MRTCADCGATEPQGIVASGGWCSPHTGVDYGVSSKTWYCTPCRAKYPEPVLYRIACVECEGDGQMTATGHCACGHTCERIVPCEMCDGEGSYLTHDCNPSCDHSVFAALSVSRGGIQFS